jgi:hypothetical protein
LERPTHIDICQTRLAENSIAVRSMILLPSLVHAAAGYHAYKRSRRFAPPIILPRRPRCPRTDIDTLNYRVSNTPLYTTSVACILCYRRTNCNAKQTSYLELRRSHLRHSESHLQLAFYCFLGSAQARTPWMGTNIHCISNNVKRLPTFSFVHDITFFNFFLFVFRFGFWSVG